MRARAHGRCAGLVKEKGDALVSYSFQEPDWLPVCECKYDEVHDTVDREDCLLHCHMEEEVAPPSEDRTTRKKPATIAKRNEENAA
jgi:hypothetical protein